MDTTAKSEFKFEMMEEREWEVMLLDLREIETWFRGIHQLAFRNYGDVLNFGLSARNPLIVPESILKQLERAKEVMVKFKGYEKKLKKEAETVLKILKNTGKYKQGNSEGRIGGVTYIIRNDEQYAIQVASNMAAFMDALLKRADMLESETQGIIKLMRKGRKEKARSAADIIELVSASRTLQSEADKFVPRLESFRFQVLQPLRMHLLNALQKTRAQ